MWEEDILPCLKNLREWYNCSSIELFIAAVSKMKIAIRITNLRSEMVLEEEKLIVERGFSTRPEGTF